MSESFITDGFSEDPHAEFLSALMCAWAYFDAERQLLEVFFECSAELPPHWFREALRIGITDFSGYHLEMISVAWTYLSGNVVRAEANRFPQHVVPPVGVRTANIGDFVLYAGECERVLPNLLALPHVVNMDDWDDCLLF